MCFVLHRHALLLRVVLDESDLQRKEFAWHVGVRPTRYPARMYYLYDELAAVGEEIAEKEGVNLFFVVGEPLESASIEELASTVA